MKKLARYGSFGSAEQYFDRYASYYVDKPEAKGKAERSRNAPDRAGLGLASIFAAALSRFCRCARWGLGR